MTQKSEIHEKLKLFFSLLRNMNGGRIECIQFDGETDFINRAVAVADLFADFGVTVKKNTSHNKLDCRDLQQSALKLLQFSGLKFMAGSNENGTIHIK